MFRYYWNQYRRRAFIRQNPWITRQKSDTSVGVTVIAVSVCFVAAVVAFWGYVGYGMLHAVRKLL